MEPEGCDQTTQFALVLVVKFGADGGYFNYVGVCNNSGTVQCLFLAQSCMYLFLHPSTYVRKYMEGQVDG